MYLNNPSHQWHGRQIVERELNPDIDCRQHHDLKNVIRFDNGDWTFASDEEISNSVPAAKSRHHWLTEHFETEQKLFKYLAHGHRGDPLWNEAISQIAPDESAECYDWLDAGQYEDSDTIESIRDEWNELNEQ